MNKYSLNKRIVASILLLIHIEMSCSNYYDPEIGKNQLIDQTTNTLLNSVPNSFNSNGQIVTLTIFAEEEEACQLFFQEQEVNYKKTDDQESGPVSSNSTLDKENFSRIEESDAYTVNLFRDMNENNEQSRNQELVSPFSASFNHEAKDAEDSIQFRDQAIISKKQVTLQEEDNQEGTTDTQLVEVIQIDPIAVQQAPNQTLSIPSLEALIDSQEEVNEETATHAQLVETIQVNDIEVEQVNDQTLSIQSSQTLTDSYEEVDEKTARDVEEYEQVRQENRNTILALRQDSNCNFCCAIFSSLLGSVLLVIGAGLSTPVDPFSISLGVVFWIMGIAIFINAYRIYYSE